MFDSKNIEARRTKLSPSKRAIFERWMQGKPAENVMVQREQSLYKEVTPHSMDTISPVPEQQRHLIDLYISNPHLDNISRLMIVPPTFDFLALKKTIAFLLRYHDALCLRFIYRPSGWQEFVTDIDIKEELVHQTDLSALNTFEQIRTLEAEVTKWQASLNIFNGPLLRVIYFNFGSQQPGRLLLTFHHLIMDHFSMDILSRDFLLVYQQIIKGEVARLQRPRTSFKTWAQWLKTFAQSALLQQELENYWLALPWHKVVPLPVECLGGGWDKNIRVTSRIISMSLNAQETRAFNSKTQILGILLTALAMTITQWTQSTVLNVAVIGHSRTIFDDIDILDTVGFIACTRYLFLDLYDVHSLQDALQAIKAQIQQVPHQGIGYSILKYLSEDAQVIKKLQHIPRPEVQFNYYKTSTSPIQRSRENKGPVADPQNKRGQIILVVAQDLGNQLQIRWSYSTNIHKHSTIETLAQNYMAFLRKIIANDEETPQ